MKIQYTFPVKVKHGRGIYGCFESPLQIDEYKEGLSIEGKTWQKSNSIYRILL